MADYLRLSSSCLKKVQPGECTLQMQAQGSRLILFSDCGHFSFHPGKVIGSNDILLLYCTGFELMPESTPATLAQVMVRLLFFAHHKAACQKISLLVLTAGNSV